MSRSLQDTLPHSTSSPSLFFAASTTVHVSLAPEFIAGTCRELLSTPPSTSPTTTAQLPLPRLTNVRAWRLTASLTVFFSTTLTPTSTFPCLLFYALCTLCVLPAVACKCEPNWWACKHVSVCAYLWISITIPHYICVGAFDWRASTSNKTTTTIANECLIKGCVEIRQREIEQWDIKWSVGEVANL